MAKITITNIPWDNTPANNQVCTISYRLTSDPDVPASYTTVTTSQVVSPTGTLVPGLDITGLLNSTSYTVAVNDNCGSLVFKKAFVTPPPGCEAGYTLSADQTYCYRTDVQPAEQEGGGSTYIVCQNTNTVYSTFATRIYKVDGYDAGGVPLDHGANQPTDIDTGTFWFNPSSNATDGPLNRLGIWACDGSGNPCGSNCPPFNIPVGFSRQFNVPETGIYYIGVAADNLATITVQDGIAGRRTVVQMDPTALADYYGSSVSGDITFKSYHIYPVLLNGGPCILEISGTNTDSASAAVIGAEVYKNTEAELIAADSIADLNIIFSTDVNQDFISTGEDFELGNWTCNSWPGYSLQFIDGNYVCVKIETSPIIP